MLRPLVDDPFASSLARAGILGLTCFAGAELGHALSLKTQDQVFATLWPPAGLLLAALVQARYRRWPTLLLAACIATLTSDVLLHDKSVAVGLGFCVANVAEACLGAWLVQRFVGVPFALTRLKDVLGLATFAGIMSTNIGASLGVGMVKLLIGTPSYWSDWKMWWIADAAGVMVFAPVVLTWSAEEIPFSGTTRPWRIVEGVVLFVGLILTTEGVYGNFLSPPLNLPVLVLPFLLWAALRFRPSFAAVALLLVALIGIWNTAQARGPYTALTPDPSQQMLRAQATLFAISVCVLALAVTVAESKQAEVVRTKLIVDLEQALNEIKTLRGLIPLCAWCKKIRDDQGYWQHLEKYLRANTEAQFTHGMCPECLARQVATVGGAGPDETEP